MDLVQMISQVGFPIAVATYSLITLNKTIKENSEIIAEQTAVMVRLCEKVGA